MSQIFETINEDKIERFEIKKSDPPIQWMNEQLKYYLENVIFKNNEEELQKFHNSLNTTLPLTYRFIQSIPESRDVMNYIIKNVYPTLQNLKDGQGSHIPLPQLLPWYPGAMAFQYDAQKRDINKEPDYVRFKNILLNGAES
ncbi:MAG: tRNA (cytosine-5-)-methyltransferase ncl1, partial [Marteilia pararefringens]